MGDGRLVALAGGGGGAKLVHGLAMVLPPERLTIVVNTADDEEMFGLHVSPDLDSVLYTLAGEIDPDTGWGLRGESFAVLEALERLGGDAWFHLGDRDLATHLRRTGLLRSGHTLSQAARALATAMGVSHPIVPMTDSHVRTVVETEEGSLSFQEYFVKRRWEPRVLGLRYRGIGGAAPSPGFLEALERADALVVCPSNPFLSIAPILALAGMGERLRAFRGPRVAVSPIVGGRALKGPLARLFPELWGEPATPVAVARYYRGLCTHMVMDLEDAPLAGRVEALGYQVSVASTVMTSDAGKAALARAVCLAAGVAMAGKAGASP